MNKMKKAAAAVLLAPAAVFAQSTSNFDLSAAGTAATDLSTQVKTLLTGDVMTAIEVVIGAALAIWAVFLVVKYVRRGGK